MSLSIAKLNYKITQMLQIKAPKISLHIYMCTCLYMVFNKDTHISHVYISENFPFSSFIQIYKSYMEKSELLLVSFFSLFKKFKSLIFFPRMLSNFLFFFALWKIYIIWKTRARMRRDLNEFSFQFSLFPFFRLDFSMSTYTYAMEYLSCIYLYIYVANIFCINFSNPFSNCVWNKR